MCFLHPISLSLSSNAQTITIYVHNLILEYFAIISCVLLGSPHSHCWRNLNRSQQTAKKPTNIQFKRKRKTETKAFDNATSIQIVQEAYCSEFARTDH